MPRRREQSILDDIFELLKIAPVWMGPALALVAFLAFRFVIPMLIPAPQGGIDSGAIFRPFLSIFSLIAPAAVIVAWIIAELWKFVNGNLLERQTGLASIRDVSWQDFERLICEAYRRKGYVSEVVGTDSGDGGVDVLLHGKDRKILVQCKQWKVHKVGVKPVRELLGVVASEKASGGIMVTSGRFTAEARAFAGRNSRIELVDGPVLADLIRDVQISAGASPLHAAASEQATPTPNCPICGSQMVIRTARQGRHAGSQFWGCREFPACKGIMQREAV